MQNQTNTNHPKPVAEIIIDGKRYIQSEGLPAIAIPLLVQLYDCCLGCICTVIIKMQYLAEEYRLLEAFKPESRINNRIFQTSKLERLDLEEFKILIAELQATKPS